MTTPMMLAILVVLVCEELANQGLIQEIDSMTSLSIILVGTLLTIFNILTEYKR